MQLIKQIINTNKSGSVSQFYNKNSYKKNTTQRKY